jgi:hypothetical protein
MGGSTNSPARLQNAVCTSAKPHYLATIFLAAFAASARAEVQVVAQYNLHGLAGIRDTAAPEALKSIVPGGPELMRSGSPKIMSNGPDCRRADYDSSIQFTAPDQCYRAARNLAAGENFVVEVWAYAAKATDDGYHAVLANGNGGSGFLLAQQGDHWVVLVGGDGTTALGKVQPQTWTHLAIVKDRGRATGWIDGKRVSHLPGLGGGAENFSIGATAPGKEPFHGWIAEVRVARFRPGKFDRATDMLLDAKKAKSDQVEHVRERARTIAALMATPGMKVVEKFDEQPTQADWLISPPKLHASVQIVADEKRQTAQIMLSNGLVSRTFLAADGNVACISLRSSDKGIEFVRSIKPEVRLRLNGGAWTEVGGLVGEPDHAFIAPQWYDMLESKEGSFRLAGISVGDPVMPYAWQPKCNAPPTPWPAKGVRVTFQFSASGKLTSANQVLVDVHYEIYDGLPVIMKTFSVRNLAAKEVAVTQFEGEHLAVQPSNSRFLHVESDYSFATANFTEQSSGVGIHVQGGRADYKDYYLGGGTTRFVRDPEWGSMATLNPAEDIFLGDPENALLLSRPSVGPDWTVKPGESFEGFRTFEILNDVPCDTERGFLAQRRFYKKLAPQTTEHQFEVHAPYSRDLKTLVPLIDQMAEMGFETLQAPEHPGGFNYADNSPANIASMKAICDYARSKGIRVGAYQLIIASHGWGSRADNFNCIDPVTKKPGSLFGQSACAASAWGDMYYTNMWKTIEAAGMGAFKPDGPYHGDPCAATDHPHHKGLEDSQWDQWMWMCKVLHEGQRRGLYLTIPDWYFLNGQCCTGMGYREATDNIDIVLQTLIYRQYIFDSTWQKTAGMGWVNLNTEVLHGGLEKNLDRYERALFVMLSSGAEVWVRGHRLYDGPNSRAMLQKWMSWYRRHRDVIQGDIIHLRRPDGRGLDYYLHVNPGGREKGMLLVFNPLDREVSQTIDLPLYYTGLSEKAAVGHEDGPASQYSLDREYHVRLPVTLPANGYTWLVIE